jgi:hypothetical protein
MARIGSGDGCDGCDGFLGNLKGIFSIFSGESLKIFF